VTPIPAHLPPVFSASCCVSPIMNVARYTEGLQSGLSLSVEHVHDGVRITRNIIQEHGKTKNGWRIEGTNEPDVARCWCLEGGRRS
jgi:hypothetical protein